MSATDAQTDLRMAEERMEEALSLARFNGSSEQIVRAEVALSAIRFAQDQVDRLVGLSSSAGSHGLTSQPLTPEEHEVLALLGRACSLMYRIIGEGPTAEGDRLEAAMRFNALQEMVLAQAAARCYPSRYRLLGNRISTGVDEVQGNP